MRGWLDFLAGWVALALVIAVGIVAVRHLVRQATGPHFRRSKPRTLKSGQTEFRLLGLDGFEEAEAFVSFVLKTYGGRILEQDLEPDEMRWVLGTPDDWITFRYDDHDGGRVTSMDRTAGGLFGRLLRDLKT